VEAIKKISEYVAQLRRVGKGHEISDNDEENCERMTMQAVSGVTECESKGEHDGKIFDMTVDASLASPAAPNTIVSIKSIAKIDDMSGDYVSGMDVDVNVSRPFAMAQEAYDGLQLEDQIVKFGDVEYGDNLLPKLASEVQKNQGRLVLMLVMKQGTSINLAVKPKTWRHRGLLGFMDDVIDNG
nr:26S proteasome non-ATPase regulatory subunit 9 [Tanacetum cinerariifolium]